MSKMSEEFENIREWLEFIIKSSNKELADLTNDFFSLDNRLRSQADIKNDNLITDFKNRLEGNNLEDLIWNETLSHYPKQLPDAICHYLIDNEIAITSLGHTRQSDKIMWVLGRHVHEAALTLGKEIFKSTSYSSEDLKLLLETFHENHWLWNSLIFEKASSQSKQKLFNQQLNSRDDFTDIKVKKKELEIEVLLKQTDSEEMIREYYSKNNPKFYQAIAQNINTPIDLLISLENIENIKCAKNIRRFSAENIKKRGRSSLL